MKKLILLFLMIPQFLFAASPTFQSFDTSDFGTSATMIWVQSNKWATLRAATNVAVNFGVTNASLINSSGNAITDINGATPGHAYQPTITYSGDGFVHNWISGSTTLGDYKHGVNFLGGIKDVGDFTYGDSACQTTIWKLDGGAAGRVRGGDSVFSTATGSTNSYNSGSGFTSIIMGVDPSSGDPVIIDSVGGSLVHSPTNRLGSMMPGNECLVFNRSTSMRGLAVCSPGLSGTDPGGYSVQYNDFANNLFRVPYHQVGVYQPTDTPYVFTVSGVSVTPAQGALYSNNGTVWEVIGTPSFSGSAPNKSGIMTMTPMPPGAPTSSGTLTKVEVTGITRAGDASIAFSSRVIGQHWQDTLTANPATGDVTVRNNLWTTNIARALTFSALGTLSDFALVDNGSGQNGIKLGSGTTAIWAAGNLQLDFFGQARFSVPAIPHDDNNIDLGDASHRWRALYVGSITVGGNPAAGITKVFTNLTSGSVIINNAAIASTSIVLPSRIATAGVTATVNPQSKSTGTVTIVSSNPSDTASVEIAILN